VSFCAIESRQQELRQKITVFSDQITYLVLNPYWYVPLSIAVKDILHQIHKDPDYLTRQNIKVFRLLLKLELILEKVNQKGYPCETLAIMSGYRTPYYNKAIGNVKYSRHLWGGTADVFIDEDPEDEMIDDLNRNGETDYQLALIPERILHYLIVFNI